MPVIYHKTNPASSSPRHSPLRQYTVHHNHARHISHHHATTITSPHQPSHQWHSISWFPIAPPRSASYPGCAAASEGAENVVEQQRRPHPPSQPHQCLTLSGATGRRCQNQYTQLVIASLLSTAALIRISFILAGAEEHPGGRPGNTPRPSAIPCCPVSRSHINTFPSSFTGSRVIQDCVKPPRAPALTSPLRVYTHAKSKQRNFLLCRL
ncbi:hypothetical protein E2C01_054144 [Portunus trituberculatus]|uniref:Uncharacterized protein n=1 Tax=Portunus trituberculatus TaxID=210409 RepID=A0A5B7GSE0_PORTR|nr:hypothetical protein [Portunus trituberculatus]